MAATAVQRPQSVGRPSNLPVIEHPMARLGSKRHLNVVGLNRAGLVSAGSMRTNQADDATNLPTLKEKMHSRTTTWPAGRPTIQCNNTYDLRENFAPQLYNIDVILKGYFVIGSVNMNSLEISNKWDIISL